LGIGASASAAVRILGMVLIFYGYYYIRAGLAGEKMREFFWWTVHTRFSAIIVLSIIALLNLAPYIIIAFGAVELCGAIWTLIELKRSKSRRVQ
jgi:hypothetical protein